MKRDLIINYSKIESISKQIGSYKSALETIQNSLKNINDILETENSGDAVTALIDKYKGLESDISSCKGELEDLYGLFSGYYYDMTNIIKPINEAAIMQVDRDDIWFNMQSIKEEVNGIGRIKNSDDSGSYIYSNTMYNPSANDADTKSCEENYKKIQEIKEKIGASVSKIKGYEDAMDSLFNNRIAHYENMDDEYAGKAKSVYGKYASAKESFDLFINNTKESIINSGKGFVNSMVGLVKGTAELFVGTCMYVTGAAVLLTGRDLSDCDKDNVEAFHKGNEMLGAILEDPELIFEGMAQQVSDDFDQKGIAYSTGSLAGLVTQLLITKKIGELRVSSELIGKAKILINGEEIDMFEVLAKRGISDKTASTIIEKLDAGDLEKLYKYLEKKPMDFNCDDIIDRINKGEKLDDILKWANERDLINNNAVYNKFIKEIESHPNKEAVKEAIEYIIKKQNSIGSEILLDEKTVQDILGRVDTKITRAELQKLKWDMLEKTTAANKSNLLASQRARLWQGGEPYFGLDTYEEMVLKKDDVVYTGYPFPTGYSFTKNTLDSINFDSRKLFEGVQVNPRILADGTGDYKSQVIGFKMMEDIPSAKGITNANPQLGKGGLEQIFTPDFKSLVREGKVEPVLSPEVMDRLKGIGVEFDPVRLQQVDADGNYIYKSICDIPEALTDDPNIIKLKNYKLTEEEVEDINHEIDKIRISGGGIN